MPQDGGALPKVRSRTLRSNSSGTALEDKVSMELRVNASALPTQKVADENASFYLDHVDEVIREMAIEAPGNLCQVDFEEEIDKGVHSPGGKFTR